MAEVMKRYELNINTCFGQGISKPSKMVKCCRKADLGGAAITDFASIDGYFDAYEAMFMDGEYSHEESSYKLIFGVRGVLAEKFLNEAEVLEYEEEIEPVSRYLTDITILVKNETGRSNLYKLISRCAEKKNMDYGKYLKIEEKDLIELREGLLIGYSCNNNIFNEIENETETCFKDPILDMIIDIIDYIEIAPYDYNPAFPWMCKPDIESYQRNVRGLIEFARKNDKPIVAVSSAMYEKKEKKEAWIRSLDIRKTRIGTLGGYSFKRDGIHEAHIRRTEDLIDNFLFLGRDIAEKIVINNTSLLADQIDFLSPINLFDLFIVHLDKKRDRKFLKNIKKRAADIYGEKLDDIILSRLKSEYEDLIFTRKIYALNQLKKFGKFLRKEGIPVTVGNSGNNCLIRYILGIGWIDPLDYNLRFDSCEGRWSGNSLFDLHIPEIYKDDIEKMLKKIGAVKTIDSRLLSFSKGAHCCDYKVNSNTWCVIPKTDECFLPIMYLKADDETGCIFGREDIMTEFVFFNVEFSKNMNFPALLEKVRRESNDNIRIDDLISYDKKFILLYQEFVDDGNLFYNSEYKEKERNIWQICKPTCFAELIKCEGLIMSVGGWEDSQREYFVNGVIDYNDMITCREDVEDVLSRYDVDKSTSWDIAERISNGKLITDKEINILNSHDVADLHLEVIRHIQSLPLKEVCIEKARIDLWLIFWKHYDPAVFYDAFIRAYTKENDILTDIISDGEECIEKYLLFVQQYGSSEMVENVLKCAREMYRNGFIYREGSVCRAEGV